MATLRITQFSDTQPDHYRAEVALEGDGARQTATVQFQFKLTPQEQENIRWYLEDYLQYLSDPAPQIAAKVEQGMAAIGVELFKAIFQANDDARDLWATLRQNLNNTRVEILTDIAQATTIPWELLRDPKTDTCLSLRSPAFVRSYSQAAQRPRLPQADGDAIRILLVICRPRGRADVPFRSVASRLIKGLGNKPDGFQLDVLRPPTFERLSRALRQAKAQGKPYHVVHFDGHGVYQDGSQLMLSGNPLVFVDRRPGRHGYLSFENGLAADNVKFVSGSDLGRLLVETDVPVLVLNACRSAHAETQDTPTKVNDTAPDQPDDPHSQVRAFGSLAQEVMDAGVAGVVAMRYNVYAMTAAQFVADLYASLVQGQTLGEAVTSGRKQLKDQPQREVAYKPVTLQDWVVPVVYEADAIALFPTPTNTPTLTITLHENDALPTTGMLDAQLPKTPDVGFFGRDETLLAIDRAFDNHAIVLLHAFAGSGKTSTAAEFGRWYALTGGLMEAGKQGFVLFTSFQRYLPLSRVLDKLGQVFERDLAQSGIHWLTLSDEQRRTVALQVLSQVPVLWLWDNVEPVAGFPDGGTQRWNEAEQQELADFLRDARTTKAKFLLTSRRDERAWLGDLPTRVQVPPMPMQERVQFARELAKKHGYHLTDVGNWLPLLRYTQGNPLTITVVIGQALRNGYRNKEQIENFVSDLKTGEAELDDDESEGRSMSLSASLSYGFTHTFNERERQQLALLHLFQGVVQVSTLQFMGMSNKDLLLVGFQHEDWSVPAVKNLNYQQGITLLNKASEIGLLMVFENGYYAIHPVLPWYFRRLYAQYYVTNKNSDSKLKFNPVRAFLNSIAVLANFLWGEYQSGNQSTVITSIQVEEANLMYALSLAKSYKYSFAIVCIMQGLRNLYSDTGRRIEWVQLVENVTPIFTDMQTNLPLTGYEVEWKSITSYRVVIAKEEERWAEAEKLQIIALNIYREEVSNLIDSPLDTLSSLQLVKLNNLAISVGQLGRIQSDQRNPNCIETFQEAMRLCKHVGNQNEEAALAYRLGIAYQDIPQLINPNQAEFWHLYSLKLADSNNQKLRGLCFLCLGDVAYQRFLLAVKSASTEIELLENHLNSALKNYSDALKQLPSHDFKSIAKAYFMIGQIYRSGGRPEQALPYYQEAIRCYEIYGELLCACKVHFATAQALANLNQIDNALLFAQAALRSYERYGGRATGDLYQEIQSFIIKIEQRGNIL
ncbi:MAG: CHAT domain-containing protein [Lyngbya sp. HA4199-MV5]|jgi:tetratricopeptide (TPR) repeat protein|nr:CHAT domain-containing protein [Lyngbya sp. HA4199-MV5]